MDSVHGSPNLLRLIFEQAAREGARKPETTTANKLAREGESVDSKIQEPCPMKSETSSSITKRSTYMPLSAVFASIVKPIASSPPTNLVHELKLNSIEVTQLSIKSDDNSSAVSPNKIRAQSPDSSTMINKSVASPTRRHHSRQWSLFVFEDWIRNAEQEWERLDELRRTLPRGESQVQLISPGHSPTRTQSQMQAMKSPGRIRKSVTQITAQNRRVEANLIAPMFRSPAPILMSPIKASPRRTRKQVLQASADRRQQQIDELKQHAMNTRKAVQAVRTRFIKPEGISDVVHVPPTQLCPSTEPATLTNHLKRNRNPMQSSSPEKQKVFGPALCRRNTATAHRKAFRELRDRMRQARKVSETRDEDSVVIMQISFDKNVEDGINSFTSSRVRSPTLSSRAPDSSS